MSEAGTILVGLNRSYRNKMVFPSSELASQSKPKMQNVIAGSSDRTGSIGEEAGEELRYGDCTSSYESNDNIQTMEIEPTTVIVTIIIQRYAPQ